MMLAASISSSTRNSSGTTPTLIRSLNASFNDITSPAINGGVSQLTRYNYDDILGEYDDLTFEFDISGYVKGLDSEFCVGADAGIPLKLAAL